MIWFSTITTVELVFIGLFVIFYLLYVGRIIRIARRLNTSYSQIFLKVILRTSYFTLFLVALMGPSFGETTREIRSVGKDILIAVDLSESMNAHDIPPTRLEKVKFELKNIVEAFSSDRVGLVIFSSESFVQCPLTYDQNALFLFIETLHTGLVPNTGTDFGPPLRMCLGKLENNEGSSLQQKSKVIVLISDGEDFGDESREVANEIKERGIRLFALGVGTERGSRIKTQQGYKKDQNGSDVISKLNRKSLRALAASTGGKYFEINQTRNDIARLINTISNIEGELRDSRQVDVSANKYYYFLSLALILLLLDGLVSLRTIRL